MSNCYNDHNGYFIDINDNSKCKGYLTSLLIACMAGCSKCWNRNYCIECKSGYYNWWYKCYGIILA